MSKFMPLIVVFLFSLSVGAQTDPSHCGNPQAVLDRYVSAVGGEAATSQLKSLQIEARAEEPHTFNSESMAHYKYWFKWLAPNRVAVRWHYLLSPGTALFNGRQWSGFDGCGRLSYNDDATPASRLERRARYAYNDAPQWMMYRIAANPIVIAIDKGLYTSFESLPGTSSSCVLEAIGETEWKTERRDQLTFDAVTGLLREWKIQAGVPRHISWVVFRFDDYRPAGAVKIPWSIYFDFYQTSITVTRVIPNPPLTETQFEPRQ
jgi:hypothetical protein